MYTYTYTYIYIYICICIYIYIYIYIYITGGRERIFLHSRCVFQVGSAVGVLFLFCVRYAVDRSDCEASTMATPEPAGGGDRKDDEAEPADREGEDLEDGGAAAAEGQEAEVEEQEGDEGQEAEVEGLEDGHA